MEDAAIGSGLGRQEQLLGKRRNVVAKIGPQEKMFLQPVLHAETRGDQRPVFALVCQNHRSYQRLRHWRRPSATEILDAAANRKVGPQPGVAVEDVKQQVIVDGVRLSLDIRLGAGSGDEGISILVEVGYFQGRASWRNDKGRRCNETQYPSDPPTPYS